MRQAAGVLLLGAAGALLSVCLFFGDSLSTGRLFWIGLVALVVSFGGIAAALAGFVPISVPSPVGCAALGFLAAFVAWTGVTMVWSIAADRSWDYFNRGLVYLAFCVLGLLVASLVPAAGPSCCRRSDGAAAGGRRLGAPRQGLPLALPRRRPPRAPAEPDRLLERARARVRDGAAARALAGDEARLATGAARGRGPARTSLRSSLLC